jgi:hypothetical protein
MTKELSMTEDAQSSQTFVIQDPLHRNREFTGVKVGEASTESQGYPRWTTLDLYRRDEDGFYVLHSIGHSVVYHTVGSACNSGTQTEPDKLPLDAEPCEKCKPADPPVGPVAMENSLIKLFICETVGDVHKAVTHTDRKTGLVSVSHVAQRLLMDAARNDPGFDSDDQVEPL